MSSTQANTTDKNKMHALLVAVVAVSLLAGCGEYGGGNAGGAGGAASAAAGAPAGGGGAEHQLLTVR